jgi:hypothetical protein
MDLYTLVNRLMAEGLVAEIARNPLAQFGTPARPYLGATLLPEREVPENEYRETAIRWRTVIANAGTRYSPAQKKGDAHITGEMLVTLGHSDIAKEYTSRDYDALIRLLARRDSMEAQAALIRWLDTVVNRALVELNEKHRWDAMVDAQVVFTGDNGYTETITYSNPAGHRVNAGGTWSSNAYDPYADIVAGAQKLADKGYGVARIIASRKVAYILARNTNIANRVGGRLEVSTSGVMQTRPRPLVSLDQVNGVLNADGLPPIELYDGQYFDQANTAKRFLADTVLVMVAATGQEEVIRETTINAGTITPMPDVIGYTAVGRPAGEPDAGRVIRMWPKDDKPPRILAEGWQTSLPVLLEPESFFVIKAIA